MSKFFKNDFMKFHALFMSLYVLTFIAGWFKGSSRFFYTIHVPIAISSLVLPLAFYIFSKNKGLIRQMIKSNFILKGSIAIKVARISTLVIMFYYLFSVSSGVILNYALYGTASLYEVFHRIHGLSKIVVPLAVTSHVVSRLLIKFKKI